MRKTRNITILLIGLFTTNLFGQSLENEKLKFWQLDTKLTLQDFKADTTKSFNNLNAKYGMKAYSYCILKSILDVPKKKRERGKKLEKVYLAPCIDKYQSISVTSDSLELAKQQVFFDITEHFARKGRRNFEALRDSTNNAYGVYWTIYSKVISQLCRDRNEMYDAYMNDVIILNKPGYYEKWRKLIDWLLNENKEYATKPEDCMRFLNEKPLTTDYIKSPDYLGEINCK